MPPGSALHVSGQNVRVEETRDIPEPSRSVEAVSAELGLAIGESIRAAVAPGDRVVADLSGLSKSEVERIWLPFTVWLVAATALLPPRSHRWWLALNVIGALLLNHLIFTNW